MFDLHVHSDVSDGRLAPTEVIDLAQRTGLTGLVITDHSIATWTPELSTYASRAGVDLPVPGMEVSAVHRGRRVHILLYGKELVELEVSARLLAPLSAKNRRLETLCERLRNKGYSVPSNTQLLNRSDSGDANPARRMLGRTVIARALERTAQLSFEDAYRAVLEADEYIPRLKSAEAYLPVVQVLQIADEANLVAAVAHPLWFCESDDQVQAALDVFRDEALSSIRAIEVSSYHHRRFDHHQALLTLVKDRGWVVLGGSDFHGNGKVGLGDEVTDAESLRQLGIL